MSLKIYHDSQIENLAEKLVEELKAERQAKGPFGFLKVAVANPNLGNWLKMKVLAKVPELSAGIEMPFLDDRFAELVGTEYTGGLELVSGREYPAFVLEAMMNHWRDDFLPFLKYIKDGIQAGQKVAGPLTIETQREARKAVQLSDKLAQLIDSYEATGYLGLLEENKDKNEVYRGEQALVETLFGTGDTKGLLEEKGKISFRQLYDAVKGKKPSGDPKRIVLFGQTSLTDLQIKVLVWLSQTHEINWYCPANIYCANSQSTFSSIEGAAAYNVDIDKTIHKLCQCLKDTFGNAIYPDERICKPNASDSVLSRLQVKFSRVGTLAAAVKVPQDASVQIVGAPGIRREVELVYNAILGVVWEKNEDGKPVPKKGMSFSDIAVLVPDMPTYRPMIEAVFEGRGQIPYGLVDTTTQDYSTYLDGFLALMDIARYGLSRKRIFAALENPCVQRAMGFSRDDVISWLELTKDYGAYEGYKEQDSDEGNVSGHFNWEWALRRMRLGLVAQDVGVTKGGDDKLPLEARDADDVYKFSEAVETLFRKLSALGNMPKAVCSSKDEKVWPDTWAGRLHKIMDEFLAVDKDDGIEPLVRARIVRTLNGLTTIAGEQSFKLPVAMVEHFVAGVECAKGGYLRHGVTIGGLRSLANVPFKQIFVLGLGEGVFPGRNDCSTLDVRNETKAEDRSDLLRPQENRARFRAAILSARDRLVLTYCNRELGSDARLYPSSPVYDVEEVLTNDVTTEKFKEFKWYPLVEYAEALERQDVGKDEEKTIHSAIADEKVGPCFEGLLPTYSKRAYILSGRKPRDGAVPAVAVDADGGKVLDPEKVELGEPTAKDLAEFVKDPFTAILKRRLGIAAKGYRDHTLFDVSPLGIPKGPVQWELEQEIVTRNFEPAFVGDMQKAYVPHDFLGKFAKEKISEVVAFWEDKVTDDERKILKGHCQPADLNDPQLPEKLAVTCRSFIDSKERTHIQLPPAAVLEPLFERLKFAKERGEKNLVFAVKVLNVEREKVGCWKWELDLVNKDAENYAGDYYEAVRSMYLGFLACAENRNSCPSFRYDDLRECLKTRAEYDYLCGYLKKPDDATALKWRQVAEAMSPEKDNNFFKKTKNAFNNDLVVMRVLDAFKREPTGDDLKTMFENLYVIPMSGVEYSAVEGGAQ